ncbi:hypothetical protein HW555_003248 [Spodoptera exigua]|uniref:Transposase Tc1-like domain-containing protein n=1 Tax=Spodoptera exigua TaxID=7107 RepID=A0A835GPL2_SPOEX|nr:hypothetical protein HW555_003248 [Spodoptera exigua]
MSYRISDHLRHRIVSLYEDNKTIKEISDQLGISRNTTKLWVQRWGDEGNVQHHKSNGRPKKTTLAQDDEIIETYQRNPFKRTQEVANAHQVSTTTIRRRLKSAGLKNRVPARKPLLTDRHKQLRLTFAYAYLNFDFTNVVFLVFSSSSDGRVSLWRINNTRYNQANILEDRRSGRITCGVWGWMSSSGPDIYAAFEQTDIIELVPGSDIIADVPIFEARSKVEANSECFVMAEIGKKEKEIRKKNTQSHAVSFPKEYLIENEPIVTFWAGFQDPVWKIFE